MTDKDGNVSSAVWKRFFVDQQRALDIDVAPNNARYVVTTANADLTNPINLGLLASGYLKIITAATIATPSTVTTIPQADVTGLVAALLLLAPLASPALTGTPTAPTATAGTNTTQVATTAFVVAPSVVTKAFADTGYVAVARQTVLVNATGGATTIKLPAPVSGISVSVKKTDASANAVTIDGNGANIDGAATQGLATQWKAFTMSSDGSNWFLTGAI